VRFSEEIEERHEQHERIVTALDASPAPPSVVDGALRSLSCEKCGHRSELAVDNAALKTLECAKCGATGTTTTREMRRSRRPREVRALTISTKRMSKREIAINRLLYPIDDEDLPKRPPTRKGCEDVPRPCPFVSCKENLYLDVSPKTGAIKLNFPDIEPGDMTTPSCALDVADRGGETLENVGRCMNMTRERVRQVEVKALMKMRPKVNADLRNAFASPEGFADDGEE
jgi:hypothetical protein